MRMGGRGMASSENGASLIPCRGGGTKESLYYVYLSPMRESNAPPTGLRFSVGNFQLFCLWREGCFLSSMGGQWVERNSCV